MLLEPRANPRAQLFRALAATSAVIFLLFPSCATTYKEFRTANVKPGEGVAIGHVRVLYNGKPFTKECSICFNSANGPCPRLTSEGLVFQAVPFGPVALRRIACLDTSVHHHTIKHASFVQPNGVVYLGNVTIEWANAGGLKGTAFLHGLVGALVDESREDGEIDVSVDADNVGQVVSAYREHIGDPKEVVYQSLANQPDAAPTVVRTGAYGRRSDADGD